MWKILFAVFCWVLAVYGGKDVYENFGDQISAKVAKAVAPLENLGEKITAKVQAGFTKNGGHRKKKYEKDFEDNEDSKYSKESEESEEPEDSEDSEDSIEAIELNDKIKNGVGGTTVITHKPSGAQLMLKNNRIFACTDHIDQDGVCSGSLNRVKLKGDSPQTDWCIFPKIINMVNDHVCLTVDGMGVSIINNQIHCESSPDKPSLMMSLDEYKKMCKSISESAVYRYIPDEDDPEHVSVPNKNPYVKCKKDRGNSCTFVEKKQDLIEPGSLISVN